MWWRFGPSPTGATLGRRRTGCGLGFAEEGADFLRGQGADGAFGHGAEEQGAFADATEEDDFGADGQQHAADLSTPTLTNRDAELELTAGDEAAESEGAPQGAVDLDAAAEGSELVFGNRRLEEQPVLLFDLVAGVGQDEGEVAIVGEEEEA